MSSQSDITFIGWKNTGWVDGSSKKYKNFLGGNSDTSLRCKGIGSVDADRKKPELRW